ncbi:major facilitator superfamily domain-containing protein 10 [Chrysoperla carnea]|uniref:major facilitator superfamily domain-containing protein 10 n=1 Tax=Chrysoperla carnea TaxID=189513 RepID=UPI001D07D887|nr:major facilitator superfamily domain-containing protein 10 [Chrysoperla carnea]
MMAEKNNNVIKNDKKPNKRATVVPPSPPKDRTIIILFISLLLDLLAFTMILPLFPALLDHYRSQENDWLYKVLTTNLEWCQTKFGVPERFNSVLFGGVLGSMFSFLQFIASPMIGALSDRFGRKPLLILCMIGITLSHVLWALSSNMLLFVLARFVGGISKGNISLSMAIIADITGRKARGRNMALVGIAFSLGFILGPIIGAAFAHWARAQTGQWYIYPALFAFLLSAMDLVFVIFAYKETLPPSKRNKVFAESLQEAFSLLNVNDLFKFQLVRGLSKKQKKEVEALGWVYFMYLFIYSGLEFTLTFLTHHVFGYTSMQQGWMFFGIGIVMSVIQGRFVRRFEEQQVVVAAVYSLWILIPSFILIGISSPATKLLNYCLYAGILVLAVSTAFVVSCLTTMVSHYGPHSQKGTVMGIFRSLGSLARAIGPIVASISFWCLGATMTYCIGSLALILPAVKLHMTFRMEENKKLS